MNTFAHLHVYTGFTNPEGVCDIRSLVKKASDLGMKALAITDKNVMFGVPDFIRACSRYEIKPIVGCEVTVGTADEHSPLVLLCEDMTGYKNLVRLVSDAWLESDSVTPIVTFYELKKHSKGLIALSAGPEGEINALLLRGDRDKAEAAALRYRSIFGAENFFIELQDHGLPEERWLLKGLAELAAQTGAQTVAANAVHYIEQKDADFQKIRACIAQGLTEQEYAGMGLCRDEYYLKSGEEMLDRFYGYEDAVTNAGEIAERCACPDLFRWYSVPPFKTPNGEPAAQYFREICRIGLEERLGWNITPEHRARLGYELDVIEKTEDAKAVDYFLMVWDAMQYARSVGIPVGPGKGSAPGSLALYACGITELDPVKYGLSFERFMNPLRITVPYVYLDIAPQYRDRLIQYLREKLGEGRVVPVCSLRTGYSEYYAILEIGRVLGMEKKQIYDFLDDFGVDFHYCSIASAIREGELSYYRSFHRPNKQLDRLIGLFYEFYCSRDILCSVNAHRCNLAILTDETADLIPLIKTEEGAVLTQYDRNALGMCGALDVDFTPLNVLGTLDKAIRCIREKEPDFRLDNIDLADQETFDMLRMGKSESVFSFENESMRELLKEAFPESMADLAALYALDRPGTEDFIQEYLDAKRHSETVTYRTPELEPILKETCGVILYQEQVMEIVRTLAGYSMAHADLTRRAIAKRMPEVLKLQREVFVDGSNGKDGLPACDGCLKRGIDEATANAVFDDIEKYCPFAFCKSHAVSYALLAYRTAYLKCHYPEEWEAAVEGDADDTDF